MIYLKKFDIMNTFPTIITLYANKKDCNRKTDQSG